MVMSPRRGVSGGCSILAGEKVGGEYKQRTNSYAWDPLALAIPDNLAEVSNPIWGVPQEAIQLLAVSRPAAGTRRGQSCGYTQDLGILISYYPSIFCTATTYTHERACWASRRHMMRDASIIQHNCCFKTVFSNHSFTHENGTTRFIIDDKFPGITSIYNRRLLLASFVMVIQE